MVGTMTYKYLVHRDNPNLSIAQVAVKGGSLSGPTNQLAYYCALFLMLFG